MIKGTHTIIFTKDAEADREFFNEVLKFPHVDTGGGWLIFKMPPSEMAFHPGESNGHHLFYLLCEDIKEFIDLMTEHKISCSEIREEPWGLIVEITLPGGGQLGVYEPLHKRP